MIKMTASILLLLLVTSAIGEEQNPEVAKRIDELEGWSSAVGTWEGTHFVQDAPDQLLQSLIDDGINESGIGIRVALEEDKADVFFKFSPGGEWTQLVGEAQLIPDKLGWHILVAREGGVWLERYFISFSRIDEEVADFVVTRTVYNWYTTDGAEAPVTFHMFSAGRATRSQKLD